jgi:mannose-6-phosphate isomerase-like protein (cupin superfamily)
MKIFKVEDYIQIQNPTPGETYRPKILTSEDRAKNLWGIFALFPPNTQVPYHFHGKRESLIIIISGEGTEVFEGKEIPIKAGDILYIPAGEKHTTINRSDKDLRFLEFQTPWSEVSDFIEVIGKDSGFKPTV